MLYPNEVVQLRNHEHYHLAEGILMSMLNRIMPPHNDVRRIFGDEYEREMLWEIEDFCQNPPEWLKGQEVRKEEKPDSTVPEEFSNSRSAIHHIPEYREIQNSLRRMQIPDTKDLKYFFGEYYPVVIDFDKEYFKRKLMRKCGIPAPMHQSRVSGVIYHLFGENRSIEDVLTARIHDVPEDLAKYYGIDDENYSLLLSRIPERVRSDVQRLTNHYDLISKFIGQLIEDEDRRIDRASFREKVYGLSVTPNFSMMAPYAEDMLEILEKNEFEGFTGERFLEEFRWKCYPKKYIKNLADTCLAINNFKLFEEKGADIDDNNHGKKPLNIYDQMRSIIKMMVWVDYAKKMSHLQPTLGLHAREGEKKSLIYAKYLCISDLLEPQSKEDFYGSFLHKLRNLQYIFYTDIET